MFICKASPKSVAGCHLWVPDCKVKMLCLYGIHFMAIPCIHEPDLLQMALHCFGAARCLWLHIIPCIPLPEKQTSHTIWLIGIACYFDGATGNAGIADIVIMTFFFIWHMPVQYNATWFPSINLWNPCILCIPGMVLLAPLMSSSQPPWFASPFFSCGPQGPQKGRENSY